MCFAYCDGIASEKIPILKKHFCILVYSYSITGVLLGLSMLAERVALRPGLLVQILSCSTLVSFQHIFYIEGRFALPVFDRFCMGGCK